MPTPPKVDPARRNARSGPLKLPAAGRQEPSPAWPLAGKLSQVEQIAWRELWATPQAIVWEKLGWTRTVARFCRVMVLAEALNPLPQYLSEARQLEDKLGLTPKAMRLLLWEIVEEVPAPVVPIAAGSRARDRMRSV